MSATHERLGSARAARLGLPARHDMNEKLAFGVHALPPSAWGFRAIGAVGATSGEGGGGSPAPWRGGATRGTSAMAGAGGAMACGSGVCTRRES